MRFYVWTCPWSLFPSRGECVEGGPRRPPRGGSFRGPYLPNHWCELLKTWGHMRNTRKILAYRRTAETEFIQWQKHTTTFFSTVEKNGVIGSIQHLWQKCGYFGHFLKPPPHITSHMFTTLPEHQLWGKLDKVGWRCLTLKSRIPWIHTLNLYHKIGVSNNALGF